PRCGPRLGIQNASSNSFCQCHGTPLCQNSTYHQGSKTKLPPASELGRPLPSLPSMQLHMRRRYFPIPAVHPPCSLAARNTEETLPRSPQSPSELAKAFLSQRR